MVILQALKWDVAAVTTADFVDVILCQISMIDVNGMSQRRAVVRQHAITFVILCAHGIITSLRSYYLLLLMPLWLLECANFLEREWTN